MKYEKYTPCKPLAPFVECYFNWEGNVENQEEVQSPPLQYGAIVVNYGDPSWAYQHSEDPTLVPDAFVCGLFTSNYHRRLSGKIGMAGIVLKGTAIHNLFGVRMSHLVNNRMQLDLLIGVEETTHLMQAIKNCPNAAERINSLEQLLLPRIQEARHRASIIDEILDYIVTDGGKVTIEDVAIKFNVSKRYIEKHFLEKVGVSPKFYSRIVRFSKVMYDVLYKKMTDWQDVVFEHGFHDQSHLAKEFIEFNQMNPSEYFEKHREMTRYVKR